MYKMKMEKKMKVQFNEGKYKGMTASGKDYETASKNLYAKLHRKQKKDLLNSFTLQEIKSIAKLVDTQIGSIDKKEFEDDVNYEGNCFELTEWKQVSDLCRKLQYLESVMFHMEQGVNKNG